MASDHAGRKARTYQAGHRAGWLVALAWLGIDPDSIPYTPPAHREAPDDADLR